MATAKKTAIRKPMTQALVKEPPQQEVQTPRPRKTLQRDPLAVTSGLHSHEENDHGIDEEQVLAVIPKNFTLTLDDHRPIHYHAGTRKIPKSHAEHWWSKVQGVTLVDA